MIPKRIHISVTEARVLEATERQMITLDNPGFCLACGEEAMECEPDARGYLCESCDNHTVYGASEVMMMGAYHK